MRKEQMKPNWGAFYKITGQYYSKMSRLEKKKAKELSKLKETKEPWQADALCDSGQDSEPRQKKSATKDIIGTIDEILTWTME